MGGFLNKKAIKDIIITVLVLISAFIISVLFQNIFSVNEHVTTIFAFAVFLISLWTNGYIYGIISTLIGTLAINFAFTFPYFAFNFSTPVNLISAIVMFTIAFFTSALTTKIKHQEFIKTESEKEKMRANLLRAVSHDIRTPLTTIYASTTTLLENESITDIQKKQILEGIKQDSDWLVRIVENLLSVTKLSGDNVKIIKTPTIVDELIDSVILKVKKRYPEKEIDIFLPDDIIAINIDPLLIEQVLINLIENSILHAKDHTFIKLSVSSNQNLVSFEIEDDGCGIQEEATNSLLNGQYKTPSDLSDSKKKNAGIGLSVCSAIIKAHGGRIFAENTNKGSKFTFVLNKES